MKRCWHRSLITLLLLLVTTAAQAIDPPGVERIPLKRSGNLFFIEATVDSIHGNFVLDLGAPYLVLNSTYFRNYQIDTTGRAGNLTSQTDYVRRTKVRHLEFGSLEFKRLEADVADLAHIENQRGLKVLGLLGLSFFRSYVFELNTAEQQLVLHPDRATCQFAALPLFSSPVRFLGDMMWIQCRVQGKKLRFSLDSAAEMNTIANDLPDKIYAPMRVLETKRVRGADGVPLEVLLVMLSGMEIGDYELQEMRTLVVNMETMSKSYGVQIHGMLGYPFFSQGIFVIDFKNRELELYPWEARQRE